MGRWEPDSAGRLVEAALTLFAERGFDQTTAEEIAKAAGLTERTFFRHFADKREVLFYGANDLKEHLVALVADAPLPASPIDAVFAALETIGKEFEERREFARRRHAVIAANPELRERELIKLQTIASALAGTLRQRGVDDTSATLAAEAGMAVFRVAFDRWVADSTHQDLPDVIEASLDELRAVTATKSRRVRRTTAPAASSA
ncbi:MAG: TetR family transcriptional regulator [Acidimicrobiales bacterium]